MYINPFPAIAKWIFSYFWSFGLPIIFHCNNPVMNDHNKVARGKFLKKVNFALATCFIVIYRCTVALFDEGAFHETPSASSMIYFLLASANRSRFIVIAFVRVFSHSHYNISTFFQEHQTFIYGCRECQRCCFR